MRWNGVFTKTKKAAENWIKRGIRNKQHLLLKNSGSVGCPEGNPEELTAQGYPVCGENERTESHIFLSYI